MSDYPVYEKTPLSRLSRVRFQWEKGSLNDNGIQILKRHNVKFCYVHFSLHALVMGRWCPIDYQKLKGNTWEMIIIHP